METHENSLTTAGATPMVLAYVAKDDRTFPPIFKNQNRVNVCSVGGFKTIVEGAHSRGADHFRYGSLVCYNHKLDETEKAWLYVLISEGCAVVAGPAAAEDSLAWEVKTRANSRGGVFEIVGNKKSLPQAVNSAVAVLLGRSARESLKGMEWLDLLRRGSKIAVAPGAVLSPDYVSAYEELLKKITADIRSILPLPDIPATPSINHSSFDDDAIGTLPGVIEATKFLRSERGRLDAEKVRDLFQLSRSDVAKLAGISDESIRQTPDSERVQPVLKSLERCARLLALNPDLANFRAWLHTENTELDGSMPLQLIQQGRSEVVATLVQDILTNRGR